MDHQAQLRICHERIGAPRKRGGVPGLPAARPPRTPETQWCSLHDVRWCYDCDRYVCEVHIISRHDGHDVRPD